MELKDDSYTISDFISCYLLVVYYLITNCLLVISCYVLVIYYLITNCLLVISCYILLVVIYLIFFNGF